MNRPAIRATSVTSIVATAAIGLLLAYGLLVKPGGQRQVQIAALTDQIATSHTQLAAIEVANQKVAEVAKRSVASTTSEARMKYQRWLLQLARDVGLAETAVIPSAARATKFGHLFSFRVEGQARPDRIAALILAIHNADAVHHITELTLTPHAGGRQHVELNLEALHIASEDSPRHELPLEAELLSQPNLFLFPGGDLFSPPQQERQLVPAAATAPRPTSLRFVATFFQHGRRYAWLLDTRTAREYSVEEHQTLVVDARPLRIAEVGEDFVEVEQHGSVRRVHLGDVAQFEE